MTAQNLTAFVAGLNRTNVTDGTVSPLLPLTQCSSPGEPNI